MEITLLPSIVNVLRRHAEFQPERTAFTFLQDGIQPSQSLTYAALDRQARSVAAFLQARLRPGERVMLCFPEGTDFVVALLGCFYAGMVAVPAPPPDTMRMKRSLARLHALHADATPALLLGAAPSDILSTAFEGTPWAYTRDIDERLWRDWQLPNIDGDDLAYLQYTSGSTTTPKGVMIRHSNLIHNLQELQDIWPYGPDSVVASWMPHFHDFGLVAGILRPLFFGVPSYLSSPLAFLKRPGTWLDVISRYRVTHSGAATFAYDYCVQKISLEDLADVDLSCWQVANVGAEPIHPSTLQAFADKFAAAGFRFEAFGPAYGMAELTVFVTGHANSGPVPIPPMILHDKPGRSVTGCGRTSDRTTLIVVDPETLMRVPDGLPGEIWIAGPSVAAGYWNRPEETRAAFNAVLADTGEGPFFRSGDIGFLREGELFITGRLKNMIIIHGENYFAEEIEWVAQQAHASIRHHASAVFAVPGKHTEQVVIVHEIDRLSQGSLDADTVMAAIRRSVTEYFGIPVHSVALVRRGTIPRTSSGKVQRHQCRDAYLEGTLACIATWTLDEQGPPVPEPVAEGVEGVEAELIRIWQMLLDVPVVTPTSNFFDLGGDSLLALQLMLAVEEQFGQPMPDGFFVQPTIEHLAHLLQAATGEAPLELRREPERSWRQQRSETLTKRVVNMRGTFKRIARDNFYRLRLLVERPIFRLPYPLGRRRLALWVGRPWVQALFYGRERRWVRRFLACLGSSVLSERKVVQAALEAHAIALRADMLIDNLNSTDLAGYEAAFGGDGPFWESFAQAARAAARNESVQGFVFSNLAALQQADRGRGVIFLTYHSPFIMFAVLALLSLKLKSVFFLNLRGIRETTRTMIMYREDVLADGTSPGAIATHVQMAHSSLRDGGAVVIAGDGEGGGSTPVWLPVHGRWFPFRTGFAELALHTGAVVLPMVISLEPDGRLRIAFHAPLDPGGENMPQVERVRSLVQQYATFFQDAILETPESLSLGQMNSFVKHARVTDAVMPADRQTEAEIKKARHGSV